MKQKLVSIYFIDVQQDKIQEHLADYLNDGWTIAQVTPLNGAGGGRTDYVSGWIIVLLQK